MDWMQAISRLQSLKENLPPTNAVERKWADDFHSDLDAAEKAISADLSSFRIPPDEFFHPAVGTSRPYVRFGRLVRGKARTNPDLKVVNRARLLHKVDAALHYFEACSNASEEPGIGFKAN
jgi:hypothetical protein